MTPHIIEKRIKLPAFHPGNIENRALCRENLYGQDHKLGCYHHPCKRMRRILIALNDRSRKLRNALPFHKLYRYLCRILKGYYNQCGFAGNYATLNKFAYAIGLLD